MIVLIGVFLSISSVYADTAEEYYNRGDAYLDKGNFDEAISCYTKAIELNPNDANGYYNRGTIYCNKNNPKRNLDQAIFDFTKAIELNPKLSTAYCNRGLAYYEKENFDQAILDSTKAIELNPRDDQAYNTMSGAYWGKKDYRKALENMQKAQELGHKISIKALDWLKKKVADEKATPKQENIIKTSFASAETTVAKNNVVDTSSLSDIKLSATTASGVPESRIAVINNAIYHAGDSVAGYKIVEIKDGYVVLIDDKGDKHEIHI